MSPLGLASFAPPRWTLLVMSHARWEYLGRTLKALDDVVGLDFFARRILSLDADLAPQDGPGGVSWEVAATGGRHGLVANLQQGWDQLGDDEWVFHLEEDFVVNDAPLDAMRQVLEANPSVAQMVLERQPANPSEWANGSLVGVDNIPTFEQWGNPDASWREQRHLFSFNPCVYHSSIATKAGVERDVTARLRADGRTFGFWGAQGDAPRCEHIGIEGGMGSAGWRA